MVLRICGFQLQHLLPLFSRRSPIAEGFQHLGVLGVVDHPVGRQSDRFPEILEGPLFRSRRELPVDDLRKATQECGTSLSLTCAYATYNYGAALNRAGDPSAAIPVLQRRLDRWPDNQPDVVRRELAAACDAAGQDCGGSSGGAPAPGPKKPPGKAKGPGKKP